MIKINPPQSYISFFLAAVLNLCSTPTNAQIPYTEDYGDVSCKPGEYAEDKDWDFEGDTIDSGWGNCHDPAVGGAGSNGKFCMRTWINANETKFDWRCGCSTTWPLVGDACADLGEHFYEFNAHNLFAGFMMMNEFKRGYRISKMMLKLSNWKLNAANIACIFATIAVFNLGFMHLSWCFRSWRMFDDEMFFYLQFPQAVAAICMAESFMGLSLAWLDIAVKSSQMSGKAKGAYKKRKIAVKTFMWSVAVINIYLYAIGRASMIGGLGLMLVLIITPTLYVGGSSLVKILDSQLAGERLKAKEEKERQIAEDVKAGVGGGLLRSHS